MTPTPPTPGIDFAAIRNSCPKAFAALIMWFCDGKHFNMGPPAPDALNEAGSGWGPYLNVGAGKLETGDFRDEYVLHPRDLFDFFDQQGVYVSVDTAIYTERIFYTRITLDKMEWLSDEYPTRAAAEAAAFTAGFAKLEQMLNQKES